MDETDKTLLVDFNNLYMATIGKNNDIFNKIFESFNVKYENINNINELKNHNLLFCLDYYKLIKLDIIKSLPYGAWVSHGSNLPKGRGWAPLNWCLINEDDSFTSTIIQIDENIDTGPIYNQMSVPITIETTIYELRQQFLQLRQFQISKFLTDIKNNGCIILCKQTDDPTYYPKRTTADSELNTNLTLKELWPLIRSCHNDEYPAWFIVGKRKIILRYEWIDTL